VNLNNSEVQSKQSQLDEGRLRGYVVCSNNFAKSKDLLALPDALFVVLQANYFENPSGTPTGTCGVLIVGGERYGWQTPFSTIRQNHIEVLGADSHTSSDCLVRDVCCLKCSMLCF
jgi:hypothetical protein